MEVQVKDLPRTPRWTLWSCSSRGTLGIASSESSLLLTAKPSSARDASVDVGLSSLQTRCVPFIGNLKSWTEAIFENPHFFCNMKKFVSYGTAMKTWQDDVTKNDFFRCGAGRRATWREDFTTNGALTCLEFLEFSALPGDLVLFQLLSAQEAMTVVQCPLQYLYNYWT